VPVIVVLPSSKRDKSRVKRAQDPNRQGYKDLLEKSGPQLGYNMSARNSFIAPEDTQPVTNTESAAVAKAVGYSQPLESSPLAQVYTAPVHSDDARSSKEDQRDPGVVMKSPRLQHLESPESSNASSSEEEDSFQARSAEEKADTNNGASGVETTPEADDRSHVTAGKKSTVWEGL
jgi:hypothetical protein